MNHPPKRQTVLEHFPKVRPTLPSSHQARYKGEYVLNREGQSFVTKISSRMEQWMHRRIASCAKNHETVLEIGAGTLNHMPFVENFQMNYDIVEPFDQLFERSPRRGRLRNIFSDIDQIHGVQSYDRIFSIAVLEHVVDLPRVVERSAILLQKGGIFQAGIPSEGEFLWGLAWRLTTGIAYRLRTGLPYGVLMRHEHVNSAREIEDVCRVFFEDVRVVRFPFAFHPLSLYAVLECRNPRREEALLHLRKNTVANE